MGCNCGGGSGTSKAKTYVVTNPDGTKKSYRTEVEAIAASKRSGGTYRVS